MKHFKSLAELREWHKPLSESYKVYLESLGADTEELFMNEFGGDLFIVEGLLDLAQISGVEGNTLLGGPCTFDLCEEFHIDPNYIYAVLITGGVGGNLYLIPKVIANSCNNVKLSMELSS